MRLLIRSDNKMLNMRILFTLLILQLITPAVFPQEWAVPEERKGRLSPFKFTDDTRRDGERLYNINCKSCHGTPGKGDFLTTLNPIPGDPASDKIQHNLDGEIFYKVTQGRGPMPSFRNSLASNDIWNIISFLRSFKSDYVQAIMPLIRSSAYPGAEIIISLLSQPEKQQVMMKVTAVSEKSSVPVIGAGVKLFVKRTFGQMIVDEEKTTDKEGIALFSIPEGFPADSAGRLYVSARFSDEDTFGAVSKDTSIIAGMKVTPVSLTAQRAMWNVVRKAPVWVILSYTFGVLGVWGFIFLVLLRLRDIYLIGEHVEKGAAVKE